VADVGSARAVLRTLVKESPHTAKHVAAQVGEEYTTFIHRINGRRTSYLNLDLSFVFAVLRTIGVPFTEYARRVEEADRG